MNVSLFPGHDGRGPGAKAIIAYVALYVLLDRLSYINEMAPLGVTPWNPPPGLSLVFMLFYGWRAAPWLFVAAFAADLVVRWLPSPVSAELLGDLHLAITYSVAGLLLRRLKHDPALTRQRDVFLLLAVGTIAALVGAIGAVTAYHLTGVIDTAHYGAAMFRFWVGDAVGIAVTTPLILLIICHRWTLSSLRQIRLTPEILAQMAALAVTQWVVYSYDLTDKFRFLYPLFIPMIWIAVRHGLPGAVLGALAMQLGLAVSSLLSDQSPAEVTELQFALLSFTIICNMVGIVVSERRRADIEVRANERRWRSLVGLAPVGIAEIDAKGFVNSVNAALEALAGCPAGALIGQPAASALPGLEGLAPGEAREVETNAEGTARWLEVSVADVSGVPGIARIAVFTDIGGRKELERRQKAHQTEVERTARINAGGQLASVMAHELNQPLTSIIYYLRAGKRLLNTPDGSAEALDAFDWAVAQAVRASDIVRNLRNFFVRGDSDAQVLDLRDAISGATDFLAAELKLNSVSLTLDLAGQPVLAVIDKVQFEQVLLNLMRNALEAIIEARRPGRLRVRAWADGAGAHIEVADNGGGVRQTIAAELFKPFTTSKSGGMGLGLTISRSLIETAGGSLDLAQSGPDGTTFAIRLPLAPGRI